MGLDPTPRADWPRIKRFLSKGFWTLVIVGLTAGNFRLWLEANELRTENKKLAVEVEANKKVLDDKARSDDALVQKIVKAIKESK